MGKYFKNEDLKRSTIYIVVFSIVLFLILNLVLYIGESYIKKMVVKNNQIMIGKIVDIHPELENEIISVITKSNGQNFKELGENILSKYSYSYKLNNFFSEDENQNITFAYILIFLISMLFLISFLYFNFKFHKIIYDKINKIDIWAKAVFSGEDNIKLEGYEEGAISKLNKNLNKMNDLLNANVLALKREKDFQKEIIEDISHQLKTPLSSLILYNELLLENKLNEEKKVEVFKITKNQLDRMEWLIKSLLKLAKINANALNLKFKEESLDSIILPCVDLLKPQTKEKNVNILVDQNCHEINIIGDRKWLMEAILNILKNAIEHSYQNGVVEIKTLEKRLYYKIDIIDNGHGIYEEDIRNIFKRFYKSKVEYKSDSVGIGLSLSKSIIEKHGGTISVKSTINKGSTFTIIIYKDI